MAKLTSYRKEVVNGIEFKNIDLTKVRETEQLEKVFEEEKELVKAIREETDAKVIEEYLDLVQAWLGYVYITRGITAKEIMEAYPKHLEKLKNRPR